MRQRFRWIVMAASLVTMSLACTPAMAIDYLATFLKKPAYVRALTGLLDNAPIWTREVLKKNGAYASSSRITRDIDGTSYDLFDVCVQMPTCADTTIIVMFTADGAQAWAGLREKGVVSYLGAPSEAQQAAFRRELSLSEPRPKVAGPYLFDVIKKPAYARASKNLRDRAGNLPNWTRQVLSGQDASYNSGPVTPVVIYGVTYEMFSVCTMEYSCNSTQLAVMFAPNGSQAWGLLVQDGAISYLGDPSDAQLAAMKGELEAYDSKWGPPAGKSCNGVSATCNH